MSKNEEDAATKVDPIAPIRAGAKRGLSLIEAAKKVGGIGAGPERVEPAAVAFGHRIRTLRQARGWTQDALAKRAGLAQGDLSNIEKGKGADGPSHRTLRALARALDDELPVNPIERFPIVVDAEADDVVYSTGHFHTYAPLFSADCWREMEVYAVKNLSKTETTLGDVATCALLRVNGAGKHVIRSAGRYVVVTALNGHGKVRFHNARHRKHHPEPVFCRPLGILGPESSVTLVPDLNSSMSVMMIDADVFLHQAAHSKAK